MMRYLEFVINNKLELLLVYSLVILVWHYKIITYSKTEIRCRVVVGDTLSEIKRRYLLECVTVLLVCFILVSVLSWMFGLYSPMGPKIFVVFCLYAAVSMIFMEAK